MGSVRGYVRKATKDSAAMKYEAKDRSKSIRNMVKDIQEGWREVIGSINAHEDSLFGVRNASTTLAALIGKVNNAIKDAAALKRLAEEGSDIFKSMAQAGEVLEKHLIAFKQALMQGSIGSRDEALGTFKNQLRYFSAEFNDLVGKEHRIDEYIEESA